MTIEEHRASTEAAASMRKSVQMGAAAVQFGTLSSVHSAAATTEYVFESSTATSMSESVISMSSSSHSMELSAQVEALSSGGLLVQGVKRGETH